MLPPQQQFSRINLADMKSQIVKKIGHDRAEKYFGHLNRFLSQKLSKLEFDSLCYKTIGADNISLHNRFIQAILKNATQGKAPPQPVLQDTSKPLRGVRRKPVITPIDVGSIQNSASTPHASPSAIWRNGDALPSPARKWRSRDRRAKDRPSPLGPHGKTDSHASPAGSEDVPITCLENGDAGVHAHSYKPVRKSSGSTEQPEGNTCGSRLPSLKRQKFSITANFQDQFSLDSKTTIGQSPIEDGEETELVEYGSNTTRDSPLRAPLGVPFCPGSIGAAKKTSFSNAVSYLTLASRDQEPGFFSNDLLPDTRSLQRHMEQMASTVGLQSVSLESANLLNTGLDVYLKRMIKSCLELKGSSHSQEAQRQAVNSQGLCKLGQGLNGSWPPYSTQLQTTGVLLDSAPRIKNGSHISFHDFAISMELDPQQLGEDWPLLREKISSINFQVPEER